MSSENTDDTNTNNFRTDYYPRCSVVDSDHSGINSSLPTNFGRDSRHANRAQESIIDLYNMSMNQGVQFANNCNNLRSIYASLYSPFPFIFANPTPTAPMSYTINPLPFGISGELPACVNSLATQQPFLEQYATSESPQHPQFQVVPDYGINYPIFQANPNAFLNPTTTANSCLQYDSYRRNFHRQRNVARQELGKKQIENDIMSLRQWEKVINTTTANKVPGFIFTLMSYNVLAQDLVDTHMSLYRSHDKGGLNWETRWKNLFAEIKKFRPEILCLQEVQKTHIKSHYALLETLGYKGIFKKRTGNQPDGCAIYYNEDHIDLIEQTTVEFHQSNVRVLDRDNVGIVAKFAPKLFPGHEFVVSTTHLLFNPKRDDVRLAQMQVLLSEVERISYKGHGNKAYYLPIILTGDFNSPPHSHLYKFLSQGKLDYEELSPRLLDNMTLVTERIGITDNCQHADLLEERKLNNNISRIEEMLLIDIDHSQFKKDKEHNHITHKSKLLRTGNLSHKFVLKSVYDHGVVKNNEATTYQNEWLTVDYIFYSNETAATQDKLNLMARYRLPTSNELGTIQIPNQSLGSDHLSLVAKFKLEF